MFSNESLYNELDAYNSGNRLFNLNDSQNIWSSDKMCPIDNNFFIKNRNVFNSNMQITDRLNRNNRKPTGNRSETNLIVNYLPDGFYEKDLHELFSKAGPIVHYHVVRNKDNRSECYGFVDYEKSSDAEKAIDMFHQFQIQNKKLKVQNAAEGLLIKEEEKSRAAKGYNNFGYNVEIRNAPIRWTINDVKNIFGKYGEILKVFENTMDDIQSVENAADNRTKTFNVIFRYQTIAQKVVRRKNNQLAEPMWPLELELAIVGQEFIEIPPENVRSNRPRSTKMRFDQMSECSWENKNENKFDNYNYYQKNYENAIFNWGDNVDLSRPGMPLSSNGRPILKHKDNLMHLNGGMYDVTGSLEHQSDKWNTTITPNPNNTIIGNENSGVFFENKMRGSCNDIKAIWEPKETIINDPIPQDVFIRTPLLPSRFRNEDKPKHKANIWFKMENMQPTGSFKLRGMAYWCYKAKLDGIQLVVSSSGGNAGLAAAYACKMFKLKCTVVVPLTTPVAIIDELLKENAEVIQEGANWKEAHSKAESIVANYPRISRLVHPFDSSLLWGGYESIVDEIVEDMKGSRLDMIVLSVGGGGMLNGIAQGISKNKLNKTTAILAIETEGAACFNQSMSANRIVNIVPDTIATSLGASSVCQRTWDIYCNKEFHLFSKTCSDAEAIDGSYQFLNEQNCLVEPACGASLSALYNGTLDQMAECRNCDLNVVIIICGGRCIDIQTLLNMRQLYSSLLSNTTNNSTPFDTTNTIQYDNTSLSNYDVTDRFLNLNIMNSNKDNTPYLVSSNDPPCDLFYNNSHSSSSSLRYDNSNIINTNNASTYNQVFPPIKNNNNNSNDTIVKSNILTESKFGYHRNIMNEHHQQQQHNNNNNNNSSSISGGHVLNYQTNYPSINTNIIIDQQQNNIINNNNNVYMSNNNDIMSSPVGSQHSDKENRMLSSNDMHN